MKKAAFFIWLTFVVYLAALFELVVLQGSHTSCGGW